MFVLPRDAAAEHGLTPEDYREKRYRAVGLFLAQQCHLLLALWDGRPTASDAGTAAVVRMTLEGPSGLPEAGLRPLDAEDGGPVYHVHTPRAGDTTRTLKKPEWLLPQEGDEALFHTLCSRLDRFNGEPLRHSVGDRLPQAAATLLPDIASRSVSERTLATAFAAADLYARHYQRTTRLVLRLTLLFAALLALTFELYAEVLPWRALPMSYLAAFASLTVILLWQRKRDVQGRYLDYRALAEGLRVQFYWRLAGLPDSASSSYLRKQLDELRWIREALRAAAALPPPQAAHPELALKYWVGGQATYYADRARSQRHRMHLFERSSQLFLGAGLLATAILVLFSGRLESLPLWHRWLVVLMGFAPIGAALWETYGERAGPADAGESVRALRGHLPPRQPLRRAAGAQSFPARQAPRPGRPAARARTGGADGKRRLGAAAAGAADRAAQGLIGRRHGRQAQAGALLKRATAGRTSVPQSSRAGDDPGAPRDVPLA